MIIFTLVKPEIYFTLCLAMSKTMLIVKLCYCPDYDFKADAPSIKAGFPMMTPGG